MAKGWFRRKKGKLVYYWSCVILQNQQLCNSERHQQRVSITHKAKQIDPK